jgi:hypothetical protein
MTMPPSKDTLLDVAMTLGFIPNVFVSVRLSGIVWDRADP